MGARITPFQLAVLGVLTLLAVSILTIRGVLVFLTFLMAPSQNFPQTQEMVPHELSDMHLGQHRAIFFVVVDKTFVESDAKLLIRQYEEKYPGRWPFEMYIFCGDDTYANYQSYQTTTIDGYFSHVLYEYYDNKGNAKVFNIRPRTSTC